MPGRIACSGAERIGLCSEGDSFNILGIQFDLRLIMNECVEEVCSEATWKLRTLLRVRRYHSTADMISLYKSRLLSFIEYRTPGLYHACDTHLHKVDRIQDSFRRAVGLSREDCLLQFNLAPLRSRRDIAMLGVIHRSVLGIGPPHLDRFSSVVHAGIQ